MSYRQAQETFGRCIEELGVLGPVGTDRLLFEILMGIRFLTEALEADMQHITSSLNATPSRSTRSGPLPALVPPQAAAPD